MDRPYSPKELELLNSLPLPHKLYDCLLIAFDKIGVGVPSGLSIGDFTIVASTAPEGVDAPYTIAIGFGELGWDPDITSAQPMLALYKQRDVGPSDPDPESNEIEAIKGEEASLLRLYQKFGELTLGEPTLAFYVWIAVIIGVAIELDQRVFWHVADHDNGSASQMHMRFHFDGVDWIWVFDLDTAIRHQAMTDAATSSRTTVGRLN